MENKECKTREILCVFVCVVYKIAEAEKGAKLWCGKQNWRIKPKTMVCCTYTQLGTNAEDTTKIKHYYTRVTAVQLLLLPPDLGGLNFNVN